MTRYRVLTVESKPDDTVAERIEDTLATASAGGWELVNVFPFFKGNGEVFALVVKK